MTKTEVVRKMIDAGCTPRQIEDTADINIHIQRYCPESIDASNYINIYLFVPGKHDYFAKILIHRRMLDQNWFTWSRKW